MHDDGLSWAGHGRQIGRHIGVVTDEDSLPTLQAEFDYEFLEGMDIPTE